MNGQTTSKALGILAALGKAAAYLALFLGSQTLVSCAYLAAESIVLMLGGGGDPDVLLEYVYGKTTEITLISGLLTLAVLVIFNLARKKPLGEALTIRRVLGEQLASAAALTPPLYLIVIVVLAMLPAAWLEGYVEASSSLSDVSAVAFISTVLVAPLVEEVVFRGLIQSRLSRVMPGWLAVLLSAGIFGLCHGQAVWMAYAFFLGCVFGFVAWRCGSIAPTILMHVIFNGLGHFATVLTELGVEDMTFLAGVLLISMGCTVLGRKGIAGLLRGPGTAEAAGGQENSKEEDGL